MLSSKSLKSLTYLLTPVLCFMLVFGLFGTSSSAYAHNGDPLIKDFIIADFYINEVLDKLELPSVSDLNSYNMEPFMEAQSTTTRYVYEGWSDGNVGEGLAWNDTAFSSVNEAIYAANPGDTIFVHNGTYDEDEVLYIDKPGLTLQAESQSTVLTTSSSNNPYGSVIFINAPDVTVDGFTITTDNSSGFGILLQNPGAGTFRNNVISGLNAGIISFDSVRDSDVIITGNTLSDISLGIGFMGGIVDSNVIIADNTLSDINSMGIFLPDSKDSDVTITANTLSDIDTGIILLNSSDSDVTITENTLSDIYMGIFLPISKDSDVTIADNTLTDTLQGIGLISENTNITIEGNSITGADKGIDLHMIYQGSVTIHENALTDCVVGITYSGIETNMQITDNQISGCVAGIDLMLDNNIVSITGNQVSNSRVYGVSIKPLIADSDEGKLGASIQFVDNIISGTQEGHGLIIEKNYGHEIISQIGPGNMISDNKLVGIHVTEGTSGVEIFRNTIERNAVGIYVEGSNNKIRGNHIADNLSVERSGIHLSSTASGNIINFNHLVGNDNGVWSDSSTTQDATRNWWGDVNGPGYYGDAIGVINDGSLLFEPWVTGAALSPDTATIKVGDTLQLDVTAYLSNDTSVNATAYTTKFTSDKPGVASVSKDGLVTALSKGTATITACFADCPTLKINVVQASSSSRGGSSATNETKKKIDASSGGTVSFKDVTVEVPGSILPEDAEFSIEKLNNSQLDNIMPSGLRLRLIGDIYEIKTMGSSNFGDNTIKIKFAYDPKEFKDGEVPVIHWYNGEEWVPLDTDVIQDEASGKWYAATEVNHLTKFAVFGLKEKVANKTIELTIDSPEALVDGNPLKLDAAPFISTKSSRAMVPIRFVSEALGAEVEWIKQNNQVIILDGEKQITLTIGSSSVVVDGGQATIDCAPVVQAPGRAFIPLRFVSETLEAEVNYNEAFKQVVIIR